MRLASLDQIQQMRSAYLRVLNGPSDGMWESVTIASAAFWEIRDRGQSIGHFAIDDGGRLVRFHIALGDARRNEIIFRSVLSARGIRQAIVSTLEPEFLAFCMRKRTHLKLHSYLFRDHGHIRVPPDVDGMTIRCADERELNRVADFYRANTEGTREWIVPFLRQRLLRRELFVLDDGETLVASGECIPSATQPAYADLGVIVGRAHRGRRIGSAVLLYLKQQAYGLGREPICSCSADNVASKNAIERAGFVSEHRMFEISFC